MDNYVRVLKSYNVFTGRAGRPEFWLFALVNFAISIILSVVDGPRNTLSSLYSLIVLVPGIAVGIRRLHDTDRSGWWLMLGAPAALSSLIAVFGALMAMTGSYALMLSLLGLAGALATLGFIGAIVLIVFCAMEGTAGTNRYGAAPAKMPSVFNTPAAQNTTVNQTPTPTTTVNTEAPAATSSPEENKEVTNNQ